MIAGAKIDTQVTDYIHQDDNSQQAARLLDYQYEDEGNKFQMEDQAQTSKPDATLVTLSNEVRSREGIFKKSDGDTKPREPTSSEYSPEDV